MSNTITIYISQELNLETLFKFINFENACLESAGEVQQIRISHGTSHFWIFHDLTLIEYLNEYELKLINKKIGVPRSSFVIEMNKEKTTLNLVKEFLMKVSEKYSLAVEIEDGNILDVEQIKMYN